MTIHEQFHRKNDAYRLYVKRMRGKTGKWFKDGTDFAIKNQRNTQTRVMNRG